MSRAKQSDALFPLMNDGPANDAAAALKIKGAKDLRTGLHRVQVLFFAFVLVSVAALVLCCPRLADEQRVDALKDLARLPGEIDVAKLRRQMAQKAERELAFDLDQVAQAVALSELTARPGAGPQAQLQTAEAPTLTSLGTLADLARTGARFPVRGPHPQILAASLRWRLERLSEKHPRVLTQLQLSHAVGLEAVDAEAIVEPARVEALQAAVAYDRSYEIYNALREHCDKLVKQKMSKKDMLPAVQERVAAYKVVAENKALMRRAALTYARRAKRALRKEAVAPDPAGGGALVVATLTADGEKPLELKIPLARPTLFATTPAFEAPAALTRLQRNPLWSEIRSLDAARASQQLEEQISFHLRSTEIEGVRISGLVALQALPLVLLFFVWALAQGCRAVTRGYSAFGSNQGARIPTPGTGRRNLDRALIVILPIAVCSLTCWALWRLHTQPWVAAALSVGLLMQSVVASRKWKELHGLLDIARHRSLVQPLPEGVLAALNVPKLRRTGSRG